MEPSFKGEVYKYCQDGDGQVLIPQSNVDKITVANYYSTPRQLGWSIHPLAKSVGTSYSVDSTVGFPFKAIESWKDQLLYATAPDMTAVMYKNYSATTVVDTLDKSVVDVNRGQNFTQQWAIQRVDGTGGALFDLKLSLNDVFNYKATADDAIYTPFIYNDLRYTASSGSNVDTGFKVISMHNALWTILQKLPFVLNPFDWNNSSKCANVDPFSISYIFGLAGWIAADYEELDYNRINQVQEQSYGYTADPFIAKSPLFR